MTPGWDLAGYALQALMMRRGSFELPMRDDKTLWVDIDEEV